MAYQDLTTERYFSAVRRYVLSSGERFATVVDADGVPAYYPTCVILAQRTQGISVETMAALARDLVHIGLWAVRERIDLNARLEAGLYFRQVEVETLAEACGLKTAALRKLTSRSVSEIRRSASISKQDLVINTLKSRRLTTALLYFDFVGKMSEAWQPKRSSELQTRIEDRNEMTRLIKAHRPRVRSSRVRNTVSAADLARVAAFVATGSASAIWKNESLALRNWALIKVLVGTGIRQGEGRQLKAGDIDLIGCELRVERRHDDPEDPRSLEPNAKTYDRTIPFNDGLAQALEDYLLGPGSDAAAKKGSSFVFLTHDNRTFGTPISAHTARKVVRDLGAHLGIEGLTPHQLRHGWIQNLADWAISEGINASDFERFANNLGGWSYMSKMATEYRGDQITKAAYEAGILVEGARS